MIMDGWMNPWLDWDCQVERGKDQADNGRNIYDLIEYHQTMGRLRPN